MDPSFRRPGRQRVAMRSLQLVIIWVPTQHTQTHTHPHPHPHTHECMHAVLMKSECVLWILLGSVPWFGHSTLVVQDIVIVGGWDTCDLSVNFYFATSSESMIILEQKL